MKAAFSRLMKTATALVKMVVFGVAWILVSIWCLILDLVVAGLKFGLVLMVFPGVIFAAIKNRKLIQKAKKN